MSSTVNEWISLDLEAQSRGLDLAETAGFNSMVEDVPTFDMRSDSELIGSAFHHPDAVQRERAIWEFGFRNRDRAFEQLRRFFEREARPDLRWNALWLAIKYCPEHAPDMLESALFDEHPEVRDWAKLYLREVTGRAISSEFQTGRYVSGASFDQTLPLQISGFAIIDVPLVGNRRVNLSPLWFSAIQGRVMACTRTDSFKTNLTIEKCMFGYHPDGSHHYEIYPFAGTSWETSDGRIQHRYTASAVHHFYTEGRVEENLDCSVPVPMLAGRSASSFAEPLPVFEGSTSFAGSRNVVRDVRGQFFGFCFTSTKHYLQHGEVLPGTVQIANPHEPVAAALINTYLCGTFRGKASDHDEDGMLDVNVIPCHGSADGRLDYFADRTYAQDPYEPSA